MLLVRTPFEPADFLLMSLEFGEEIILHSEVSVQNALISRPSTQHGTVPCDTPNTPLMSHVAFHHFLFYRIPCLKFSVGCADSEFRSIVRP